VTGKVLVAGLGNIFLGDDGFGVEVAGRLAGDELPDGVKVVDYGIRGMHLAYDLANGFDLAILIDATARGGAPGTIYVIEPDLDSGTGHNSAHDNSAADSDGGTAVAAANPMFDAHGMQPDVVLGMLNMLDGGRPDRILVVGCEPASIDYGIGLSDAVTAAVDEAVRVVLELVAAQYGKREQQQGVGTMGAQSAGGRSQLFMEGWTHVPRHSR
jgi:hydrogenase maturation protease